MRKTNTARVLGGLLLLAKHVYATETLYQVDCLIFRYPQPQTSERVWSTQKLFVRPEKSFPLEALSTANTQNLDFMKIEKKLLLENIITIFRKSWIQPIDLTEYYGAVHLLLHQEQENTLSFLNPQLDGYLKIASGKQVQISGYFLWREKNLDTTDTEERTTSNPVSTVQQSDAYKYFVFNQTYSGGLNKIVYMDSPVIGVLLKISQCSKN